jgi:hemoglobin-like flavoprotein
MTPTQVALVRAGFDRIAPVAEDVGLAFYQKLFQLDPSLRALFPEDLRPQVGHLMTALTMVIRSLDDLSPVIGRVRVLGRSHASYGVKPHDFSTVGAALLATLEEGLNEDFTEDARQAWTMAYTTLAGAMTAAMAEAAPPA